MNLPFHQNIQIIKPIRKIIQGQNLFIDLNGFTDEMDEEKIEQEWGRSTGATFLRESTCKYDIAEKIDEANRELQSKHSLSIETNDFNCNMFGKHSPHATLKKIVHFSDTIHTAHYLPTFGGDIDDFEDETTAGYWSADDIRATPDEEAFISEECEAVISFCDQQEVISCQSPGSVEYWNDSDDESSLDLSALTDSIDQLDLSPLITDSPDDLLTSFSPLKDSYSSSQFKKSNREENNKTQIGQRVNVCNKNCTRNEKKIEIKSKQDIKLSCSEYKLNKWNISDNLNMWIENQDKAGLKKNCTDERNRREPKSRYMEVPKSTEDNKVQRRICLCRQDQSKLPKYNGLRSEYGLSQQQLNERKRRKSERRKIRYQRRINKQHEAEERKRENEIVFNKWLDKKRQQENEFKNKHNKFNQLHKCFYIPQQRVSSAQTRKSQQVDGSKLGLLRRIMSASVHSPKERLTYNIYLGLPIN